MTHVGCRVADLYFLHLKPWDKGLSSCQPLLFPVFVDLLDDLLLHFAQVPRRECGCGYELAVLLPHDLLLFLHSLRLLALLFLFTVRLEAKRDHERFGQRHEDSEQDGRSHTTECFLQKDLKEAVLVLDFLTSEKKPMRIEHVMW